MDFEHQGKKYGIVITAKEKVFYIMRIIEGCRYKFDDKKFFVAEISAENMHEAIEKFKNNQYYRIYCHELPIF